MKYVIVPQSDIDKLAKEYYRRHTSGQPNEMLDSMASWRIINRKYTILPKWLCLFFKNLDGRIK